MSNHTCRFIILFSIFIMISIMIQMCHSQTLDLKKEYGCESVNNNFCCGRGCIEGCGNCQYNASTNIKCCSINLISSNKKCGDKVKAPCIIDYNEIEKKAKKKNNKKNNNKKDKKNKKDKDKKSKNAINWFEDLNVVEIVLLSIAAGICVILSICSCCFFGNKYPSLKYDMIMDKIVID